MSLNLEAAFERAKHHEEVKKMLPGRYALFYNMIDGFDFNYMPKKTPVYFPPVGPKMARKLWDLFANESELLEGD